MPKHTRRLSACRLLAQPHAECSYAPHGYSRHVLKLFALVGGRCTDYGGTAFYFARWLPTQRLTSSESRRHRSPFLMPCLTATGLLERHLCDGKSQVTGEQRWTPTRWSQCRNRPCAYRVTPAQSSPHRVAFRSTTTGHSASHRLDAAVTRTSRRSCKAVSM